jgi:hypothetical protein
VKKAASRFLFAIGILLLALSLNPMCAMLREAAVRHSIESRYIVNHADMKDGFPAILQTSEITVFGRHVKITEEKTGRQAPSTYWDREEHVPPGDIVKVQIELDGSKIAEPTEMWLSNRARGSRYFSWLDVLTVKDRETGENQIAIVQRLTNDQERMDKRQWRIIYVHENGEWEQETFSYPERSHFQLGVKLVMVSGTSLMAMGYYSDILQVYPSLIFPLLYPWGSAAFKQSDSTPRTRCRYRRRQAAVLPPCCRP